MVVVVVANEIVPHPRAIHQRVEMLMVENVMRKDLPVVQQEERSDWSSNYSS